MSNLIGANNYTKKNPGRMASFRTNCQTIGGKNGRGIETFKQKFSRLFVLEKFLKQEDQIYCLEMDILLLKIMIQSK
jgi:hypothetical protein